MSRVEVIGSATLYLGDCREILSALGRVDCIVTDPPYGIGAAKKGAHSSIRDNARWAPASWDDAAADIDGLLSMGIPSMIWGGNYFDVPPSSGWFAWIKPEAGTGFSMADMELCWTNLPIAARVFRCNRRDGNEHPTQKPVALMEWCLGFVPSAHTVLDPYAGSGSTGVACARLGRSFIGIERDERYFDVMCRRITEAHRQADLFIAPADPERGYQQAALSLHDVVGREP